MKPLHTTLGLLSACTLAIALPAQAGGWGKGGMHHLDDKLDLTEAQEERLEALEDAIEDNRDRMEDAYHELRDGNKEETRVFWLRENLSAADIKAMYSRQMEKRQALMQPDDKVMQALADFHASLNEDQREDLAKMMSRGKIIGFMGKGHGRRH